MSNPKRPELSAMPRLTEPLDSDELTAHFAVPRELLDKLRLDKLRDDDATRVGPMPADLLAELDREIRESVHTSPTLPPPGPAAPLAAPAASAPLAAPAAHVALLPASDAELRDQLHAMRRPQRVARGMFVALLVVVAAVLLAARLLAR